MTSGTPAVTTTNASTLGDWAGRLTVAGAELAYLGLVVYLVWITWDSASGEVPGVSDGVVGVTGALAAVFGVGYASVLGLTPAPPGPRAAGVGGWLKSVFTLPNILGAGVFLYMAAGTALGATYLFNEAEAPGVVKTIAVGFGGYVIAYIGQAYKAYK